MKIIKNKYKFKKDKESLIGKGGFGNVYKGPNKNLEEIAYKAIKIEKVGHYALRIFWGDHHSDGLYTYHFLQKLGDS